MSDRRAVVVGDSIAGVTAARELRALGHRGTITMIGADPYGSYARPPLSKAVLEDSAADATLGYRLDDLDITKVCSRAVAADFDRRTVVTADGDSLSYDALIIASGAEARRIAATGQRGELVLRTLDDARALRTRLDTAASVIVVGAGFLGMEIVSACVARGIPVTVIDVDPPLRTILGTYLSDAISARAEQHGVRLVRANEFVTLVGDPVSGVALSDGAVLTADLVVTCAGEVPNTSWLADTGVADRNGIGVDDACATTVPDVYAAGDVAYLRAANRRAPFWSNAVAQAKVAAASALGLQPTGIAGDDYFWTEILGISIKVVGALPLTGAPSRVEGSLADGSALLTWRHGTGRSTVVAYGVRKPIARLRALAASHTH
ncbi:NAD(P)/FAD-dependent oxidoreductase [Nocardia otitidiscaviarum]|uniref:NAD(P)/FAD-dependent oxidoreductase n=1 Tax=Nocardia otitidiscaviarum TaxID=1823 RepID=UPI0024570B29|nr:FAD-dependent oxidoreductase [Nocardia otitidiscaviarum]